MVDRLEQKLIAAARRVQPEERVPLAFERRILALIGSPPPFDPWQAWSRVLWRAAALCLAITLLSGVWAFWDTRANSEPMDLEHAVLAAVDHPGGVW